MSTGDKPLKASCLSWLFRGDWMELRKTARLIIAIYEAGYPQIFTQNRVTRHIDYLKSK